MALSRISKHKFRMEWTVPLAGTVRNYRMADDLAAGTGNIGNIRTGVLRRFSSDNWAPLPPLFALDVMVSRLGGAPKNVIFSGASLAAGILADNRLHGGERRKSFAHWPVARVEETFRAKSLPHRLQHRSIKLHVARG